MYYDMTSFTQARKVFLHLAVNFQVLHTLFRLRRESSGSICSHLVREELRATVRVMTLGALYGADVYDIDGCGF